MIYKFKDSPTIYRNKITPINIPDWVDITDVGFWEMESNSIGNTQNAIWNGTGWEPFQFVQYLIWDIEKYPQVQFSQIRYTLEWDYPYNVYPYYLNPTFMMYTFGEPDITPIHINEVQSFTNHPQVYTLTTAFADDVGMGGIVTNTMISNAGSPPVATIRIAKIEIYKPTGL